MNALKTLRAHWKKSAFGLGAAGYGLYSLHNYLQVSSHMRMICKEVMATNQKGKVPKRVIVILNPSANKKKAETMFNKYCEPLLHLSSCQVEVIKTNYSGHAKVIVENMHVLPDVLVIAGGDGTSSEVVTGLLRRKDEPCPILLLPLGQSNGTVWEYLKNHPKNKVEYIKTLSETIFPMLKENIWNKSVIKYDVIDNEGKNSVDAKAKPIFGLHQFSWGVLRDIESIKDKYWVFGYLRYHAAALLNSFSKDFNWKFTTELECTPPCPGCQNCVTDTDKNHSKFYFSNLFASKVGYSKPRLMENENCSAKQICRIETNQLYIACKNNTNGFSELQIESINSISPGIDFIKKITNVANSEMEPNFILKSRTIYLKPDTKMSAQGSFSIDGEEYDIRPIKIAIIQNAIKLFY